MSRRVLVHDLIGGSLDKPKNRGHDQWVPVITSIPLFEEATVLGIHFWAKGYCVDTVGVDAEIIRKYVKYQEKQELRQQEMNFRK